jgi:hypothetical protein
VYFESRPAYTAATGKDKDPDHLPGLKLVDVEERYGQAGR